MRIVNIKLNVHKHGSVTIPSGGQRDTCSEALQVRRDPRKSVEDIQELVLELQLLGEDKHTFTPTFRARLPYSSVYMTRNQPGAP